MRTKRLLALSFVLFTLVLALRCSAPSKDGGYLDAQDNLAGTRAYKTRTGKTIIISETHPVGRSLSNIAINTQDFEHDFSEVFKDKNPISKVLLADLDQNGFDEIYIITASAGSGSYGNILGFASNKDKSLSMINFPKIEEGDKAFKGYMGHDYFEIRNHKLVRTFPVFRPGDTNQNPTGGNRKLLYGLYPGEAMWQLKIERIE